MISHVVLKMMFVFCYKVTFSASQLFFSWNVSFVVFPVIFFCGRYLSTLLATVLLGLATTTFCRLRWIGASCWSLAIWLFNSIAKADVVVGKSSNLFQCTGQSLSLIFSSIWAFRNHWLCSWWRHISLSQSSFTTLFRSVRILHMLLQTTFSSGAVATDLTRKAAMSVHVTVVMESRRAAKPTNSTNQSIVIRWLSVGISMARSAEKCTAFLVVVCALTIDHWRWVQQIVVAWNTDFHWTLSGVIGIWSVDEVLWKTQQQASKINSIY